MVWTWSKKSAAGPCRLPVLVLSLHDESVWAERAIRAGARGYVMKKEASESVISAIRNILDGKIHVSSDMMAHLLDKFQVNPEARELRL